MGRGGFIAGKFAQSTVRTEHRPSSRCKAEAELRRFRHSCKTRTRRAPPAPRRPRCLRLLRPLGRGPRGATCAQEEEEEGFRPWPWPSFRDFATSLGDAHLGLRNWEALACHRSMALRKEPNLAASLSPGIQALGPSPLTVLTVLPRTLCAGPLHLFAVPRPHDQRRPTIWPVLWAISATRLPSNRSMVSADWKANLPHPALGLG